MQYEIHTDAYLGVPEDGIVVVEAKDAYEAAIQFVARWAPVKIRRLRPEVEGDVFLVQPTDAQGDERGTEIEVFEHDPEAEPWV